MNIRYSLGKFDTDNHLNTRKMARLTESRARIDRNRREVIDFRKLTSKREERISVSWCLRVSRFRPAERRARVNGTRTIGVGSDRRSTREEQRARRQRRRVGLSWWPARTPWSWPPAVFFRSSVTSIGTQSRLPPRISWRGSASRTSRWSRNQRTRRTAIWRRPRCLLRRRSRPGVATRPRHTVFAPMHAVFGPWPTPALFGHILICARTILCVRNAVSVGLSWLEVVRTQGNVAQRTFIGILGCITVVGSLAVVITVMIHLDLMSQGFWYLSSIHSKIWNTVFLFVVLQSTSTTTIESLDSIRRRTKKLW